MAQNNYCCDNCTAEFKIRHQMDEVYFEVNFCPFCGAEITEDIAEDSSDDE